MFKIYATNWRQSILIAFFAGGICLAQAGNYFLDANTDLATYKPGNGVTLYVDLTNSTGSTFSGSVVVAISHLGDVTTNLPAQSLASFGAHQTTTKVFNWTPPAVDFQGYQVSINILDSGGNPVDGGSCAVDVSSDWSEFPRYGYVAHYDSTLNAYNLIWQLKNYHLNGIQFYDWQWKHHIPYNSGATWPDVANRTISRATLTNFIAAAHSYGMMAMNYNSYGMAYSNYLSDGSGVTLAMGLFSSSTASLASQYGYNLPGGWATTKLYEMNNRDTNWQNYIYGREQAVFTNFAFDGWHIDTVGQHTGYDYGGNFFSLDDYNPQFINNARTALGKRMVFNTVDAGGESQVAQNANVDFVYSELWSGNSNYYSFKERVDSVRSYGSKALVMPAYMNSSLTSGFFNEASVRLADAAMFACGGSHLELGDGDKMLNNPYFPSDTSVLMTASLTAAMHSYYDFLVGYENLLRGDTVSAGNVATINGISTSTNGATGTVWLISRKNFGANILHLVNLLNAPSTGWRDENGNYPAPLLQNNLAVKFYYRGSISGGRLWYATPDANNGAASQLTYTTGSDAGGNYINFTVPQLLYWDMIWLEINGTNSATSQMQAENYDSMAGIGTEATSDTGGGLDVGFVANTNGDSYVAFNNVDFGSGVASVSARVASAAAGGVIEFHLGSANGTLIATVPVGNTGGWQSWQTVSAPVSGAAGVQKLFAVFKNAAANLNWFTFAAPLPAPWATSDIGTVGLTGNANYSAGTFSVAGSGTDIESTADAFRYVYQPMGPNGEVRAHVMRVQGTDPWAKAGVMIRDSLASNAVNAAVILTASNGVEFQSRATTGGGTSGTVVSGPAAPQWVRLVRSATNSFSAYYSADGSNWIQIGTATSLPISNNASAGLAVTAHNNGLLNTSTFNNVTINQPPSLTAISSQTLIAGATLTLTNVASDPDLPAQTLSFNLLNAPTNATLNPASGVFTWRPAIAQSPSSQTVSVVVSDDGVPPMSATQNFLLTVTRPVSPLLNAVSLANGQFGFEVNGDAGPDYSILTSTDLVTWSSIAVSNAATPPFFWTDTNAPYAMARFYRVVLGP